MKSILNCSTSLLLILIISTGCQSRSTIDNYIEPELTHTLKKIGEYEIPVDSMTATNFLHYQYLEEDGIEYFTMLNSIKQEINLYNINRKELAFTIPLSFEGPNGIGNLEGFNSGYFIHNLDSIFILNRTRRQLFLVNGESELINSFDSFRDTSLPSAVIAPFAPMLLHDNEAILLNIQNGMKYGGRNKSYRSDYAMKVGLENRDYNYFLSYPDVFTKGTWGFDLHRISWAFDKESERIAVSYPLDHNIYLIDFDGNLIESIPARSEVIIDAESISKSQLKSKTGASEYYFSQGKYGKIHYDPIRKIYLRDCIPGLSLDKQKAGVTKLDRRLVILDKDMKKTGEVKTSSDMRLNLFFGREGIHQHVPTANEDMLKFELYDYVSINK
ncbi:DUF4221 family protein [Roseivirga sp.]|uniref:DUF4221 family protein n=1 Tax=Roseivirga sp. TaxID=1964215 RepID=UPI003B8DBFEC